MDKNKWDEIKCLVEEKANVHTSTIAQLRDAHGAARLGIHVRDAIANTLAGLGLGQVPEVLPDYQDELVRLYKKGTPVGDLIETVLTPGGENHSKLREKVAGTDVDYAGILAKIRELVSE